MRRRAGTEFAHRSATAAAAAAAAAAASGSASGSANGGEGGGGGGGAGGEGGAGVDPLAKPSGPGPHHAWTVRCVGPSARTTAQSEVLRA